MKKLALLSLVMVILVSLFSVFVHKRELSQWKDAYWEVKELHNETLSQNIRLHKVILKYKASLPIEFLQEVYPKASSQRLKDFQEKVHED